MNIKILLSTILVQSILLPIVMANPRSDAIDFETMIVIIEQKTSTYSVKKTKSATRTDTPIKQIPQSVHVIPRQLIDDQQNITISESLNNVSSVVPNYELSSPAFETTLIRGFAAEQLLDGFTQFYNPGDRESLINIDRLEVLKGSNAVLFSGGSGSPVGGVINIISKLPQPEMFGEVGIKQGSHGFKQAFFDHNQPITDNILVRFTGEYTSTESDINVIDQDRYNFTPAITFTNNKDTSLTLQSKHSRWQQQEYQGLPATGTVTGIFRVESDLFIGNEGIPDSKSEFDGIWATLDHKINDQWSFNIKARYAKSEFEENVQSISGVDGFTANRPLLPPSTWQLANAQIYQKQLEKSMLGNMTYKYNIGKTKNTLLIGADYSELRDEGFLTADSFISANFVDLTNPSFTAPYITPAKSAFTTFIDAELKNTTYGVYAQLQSSIEDRIHLLAGLRRATVKIRYDEFSIGSQTKTNETKVLPRFGLVFDLNDHYSLFASYSEGIRASSYTIFSPSVSPKPPKSKTREAGLKFDINSVFTGQFSFYNIERTDVEVGFPAIPTGEQRSRGFDTDITWQPTPAWSLIANYAYTDAEFTNDVDATIVSGNKLAGVPKRAARLWVKHQFQTGLFKNLNIGIGVRWQSKAYIDNTNNFTADSFHTVDAAINYETDRYKLNLSIKNLTDEDYFQFYNYFGGRVRPAEGIAAYLSAAFKY